MTSGSQHSKERPLILWPLVLFHVGAASSGILCCCSYFLFFYLRAAASLAVKKINDLRVFCRGVAVAVCVDVAADEARGPPGVQHGIGRECDEENKLSAPERQF